jgi:hypothetical protein
MDMRYHFRVQMLCALLLAPIAAWAQPGRSADMERIGDADVDDFLILSAAPEPAASQTMQSGTRRFALGIETGGLKYSGDIDNNTMFTDAVANAHVYATILFKYRLYAHRRQYFSIALRSYAGIYPMSADSKQFSFSDLAFGGGIGLELEFFLRSKLRPYLHIAAGVLSFLPDVSYTEEFSRKHPEQFRGSATLTGVVPAGIGLLYQMGRQADLSLQFTKTLTFTDNLDGWESGIMDNFQSVSLGFLYYFR